MIKIKIGISNQVYENFIADSKLSTDYEIESYILTKHFSAEGGEFIPLVISIFHSFSEGLISGVGEYAFKNLVNKISILIKGHVNYKKPPTSFKINISHGDIKAEIKAINVTSENVDNALKEFRKIIVETDKKKISQKSYFNATSNSWTMESDAKSVYGKSLDDASQKYSD
jgi:hypothetical protein